MFDTVKISEIFHPAGYFGETDPSFGDTDPLKVYNIKERKRLTKLQFFS